MTKEKSKIQHEEGTVFAVPLRSNGYVRGVIARLNERGLLFAYFFGPKLLSLDHFALADLSPDRAILIGKCGDLGLLEGKWPVIGRIVPWKRALWPMPPLIR